MAMRRAGKESVRGRGPPQKSECAFHTPIPWMRVASGGYCSADSEETAPGEPDPAASRSQSASPRLLESGRRNEGARSC